MAHKKKIQISNSSTLPIIREIRVIIKYHSSSNSYCQKVLTYCVGEVEGKSHILVYYSWECKATPPLWRKYGNF